MRRTFQGVFTEKAATAGARMARQSAQQQLGQIGGGTAPAGPLPGGTAPASFPQSPRSEAVTSQVRQHAASEVLRKSQEQVTSAARFGGKGHRSYSSNIHKKF